MTTISSLGVGSGLDLNGLLEKLEKGENKRLTPIINKKNSYEAEISAFGALQSTLDQFRDTVKALSDPATFRAVTSKVSGEALTAGATSDTPPGDYRIHVQQRARASSVATLGVTDNEANLGAGTVSMTLGNGETLTVSVEAENSSLQDLRDAINAKNAGVRASLINDGSGQPWRLVLTADKTGTDAAVSNIQFTGDLGGPLTLDASTRLSARNAQLTVNGVQVSSQSNRIEGAIQGVTMNLVETGDVTLQVSRDNGAIKSAVSDFVEAYNKLEKTIDDLTHYDAETGTAGVLLGDGTVRTVESRLHRALGSAFGEGEFSVLSDVGVTLQLDGTLKLDEEKLADVVANQASDMRQLFTGGSQGTGLAERLNEVVGKMVADKGLLADATSGLKQSIENLEQRYDRTQQRIDDVMDRYRRQFSQLDALIAKMNSTSSYLTQQFEALSNMGGGS